MLIDIQRREKAEGNGVSLISFFVQTLNSGVFSAACRERAQIYSIGVPYIGPVLCFSLEERHEDPGASLLEDYKHD